MVIVESVALADHDLQRDRRAGAPARRRQPVLAARRHGPLRPAASAARRSSASCSSATPITASSARRRSPPSACSPSPRSRSSRRPSSAGSSGGAPTRAAPWPACSRASPSGPTRCSCPPSPRPASLPLGFVEEGPFGLSLLRPQALFAIGFDPLTHGVFWSLVANVTVFVAVSLLAQPAADRAPAGQRLRAAGTDAAADPEAGDDQVTRRRADGDGRALSRRGAQPPRPSSASPSASAARSTRATRPTFACCASPSSCSPAPSAPPPRASCSRCILNRDDRRSTDAHRLLDDAEQALHYNRDLLQTVARPRRPGRRRLRPRDAPRVLEPAVPHASRPAAGVRPGRPLARRDHAPPRRGAGSSAPAIPRRRHARACEDLLAGIGRDRAAPSRHRPRPHDRAAPLRRRRARPRRHRRHRADGERSRARPLQGDAREAGGGAHRGADPPQRRAGARQPRGGGSEHRQDALLRRRRPRHPAAAQRRAPLRHRARRAHRRRR